jgi:GGDEF domain-containing protein
VTTLRTVPARDEYRSLFDPLTGLPKRALLHDRLSGALARAGRANCFVGLFSISVEFDVLRSNQAKVRAIHDIAVRLTSLLRPDDTAARVEDSSSFVVVCNVVEDEGNLESIAERIVSKLSPPLAFDMEPIEVTVAITSMLACSRDNPEALLDDAARAALAS